MVASLRSFVVSSPVCAAVTARRGGESRLSGCFKLAAAPRPRLAARLSLSPRTAPRYGAEAPARATRAAAEKPGASVSRGYLAPLGPSKCLRSWALKSLAVSPY